MPEAGTIRSFSSSANSPGFNPMLYFVRTTVLSAFLKLYTADWENDAQSRNKALFTISQMADDIRAISGIPFAQFHVCIGVSKCGTLHGGLLILAGSMYGSLVAKHVFRRFTETLLRLHRSQRFDFVMPNSTSMLLLAHLPP
jgi:uncharacterized membrane protein YdjX (TVP38/TMEM64 family)